MAHEGLLAIESLLTAFRLELVYAETSDPVTDFRNLIDPLVLLLSGPTGRIVASVVAEAQGDLQTRQAFLEFSMPLRQQSGQILSRGITSNVLRADLDIVVVLDLTIDAAYLRLLMGASLGRDWSRSLVDTVLQGCISSCTQHLHE